MAMESRLPKVILLHNHDNTWTADDLVEVEQEHRRVMDGLRAHGYEAIDAKVYHSVSQVLRAIGCDPRHSVVFNWCEGYADRPWDYAGVADELEHLKFIYTGTSSWTLRVSQDKKLARSILAEAGVPLPMGRVVRKSSGILWDIYPAIVKPINQHGSYGIDRDALVMDAGQLRQRVEYVLDTFAAPALIEEYIDGREFQVMVWGNAPVGTLPAVEVVFNSVDAPRDQIMTYELKFAPMALERHQVRLICPPMMTGSVRRQLKQVCVQAYRALHGQDYARIDVRLCHDQPYVLDVNPNPDISSESLAAIAMAAEGLTYEDMIAQIVSFATERWSLAHGREIFAQHHRTKVAQRWRPIEQVNH